MAGIKPDQFWGYKRDTGVLYILQGSVQTSTNEWHRMEGNRSPWNVMEPWTLDGVTNSVSFPVFSLTMYSLLALLSLLICFPLLSQVLYFYVWFFVLHWFVPFYVSFHFSIKGCAWFPSRVQQFLCQMTRSWHHASALHLALHCSALVWDCLCFYTDI